MLVYDARYFEDSNDLAGIWDAVGAIGASAVQLIPSLFGGSGSAGGPARGLAAINAFGQQAISTLQRILQMLQARQLSPADAIANAERIVAALSDPNYVYQAQRGNDAAALQNWKAQAARLLQQIQTLAGSQSPAVGAGGVAGVNNPLGSGALPATSGGLGLSNTALLLIGGVALIVLLK